MYETGTDCPLQPKLCEQSSKSLVKERAAETELEGAVKWLCWLALLFHPTFSQLLLPSTEKAREKSPGVGLVLRSALCFTGLNPK